MKYRVSVIRYGFADVEANDRAEAIITVYGLSPEEIDWTDGWMAVSAVPEDESEES